MRICELKEKEVINVCSGKRLGCIADVEINICTGEIEAIVIPGPGKICGFFGTDCEYVIPFWKIPGLLREILKRIECFRGDKKIFAKILKRVV